MRLPDIHKKLCLALTAAAAIAAGILFPAGAQAADSYPDAYSAHGTLSVSESGSVDDVFGHSYQIRGMSIDTSSLNTDYLTEDTFLTLKDELQVNTVRIPVQLYGADGYCEGDDTTKAVIRSSVYTALNAAIYQDMYAILDWDLSDTEDLLTCRDQAHTFLEDIAQAYSSFPNVIYDV